MKVQKPFFVKHEAGLVENDIESTLKATLRNEGEYIFSRIVVIRFFLCLAVTQQCKAPEFLSRSDSPWS
jgi:hypothetical protein